MSTIQALFMLAIVLSLGIGAGIPAILRALKTWGKTAIFSIRPGSNEINLIWRRPNANGVALVSKEDPVQVPLNDAKYLHLHQGKPAFIINRATGSPLIVNPDSGSFLGLDGRSWYNHHRDTRVQQVQRSGSQNLETLMKYALIGIVVIVAGIVGLGVMVSRSGAA